MSEFVHLHCHTEYSLLDGAIRLNDLCARAKDFGMPAAAITDHGNLYGAAYFYTTCKSYGIKPVIGCEVYVATRTRFDWRRTTRGTITLFVLSPRAFWTASIISPAWIKPCSASTAKGSLRFPRALPVKSPAR